MTASFIAIIIATCISVIVGLVLLSHGVYLVATSDSRPDVQDKGVLNAMRGTVVLICSLPFYVYIVVGIFST